MRVLLGGGLLLAGLIGGAGLLSGCSPSPTNSPGTNTKQTNETAAAAQARCDELLVNVLDILEPERLGITAAGQPAIALLNNEWVPECGPKAIAEELDPETERLLSRQFSADELGPLTASRFVDRDAEHIRDAMLFRDQVGFITQGAESDVDRAVMLFRHIMRNIALTEPVADAPPLTPFEIVLFGRGTAEDRAWVFAELLRQLRIEAVLLRPQSEDDAGPFLVGVLLDGEVYLFDPRLGWPIPSPADPGDEPLVRLPATLAEVLDDDGLLRQLDVDDRPYPFRAGDLQTPRVELIGDFTLWSSRMQALQTSLAGRQAVVISDLLAGQSETAGEGLATRVIRGSGGRWTADDLGIWMWPQENLRGYERLTEQHDQKLARAWDALKNGQTLEQLDVNRHQKQWLAARLPFDTPVPLSVDREAQQIRFGSPARQQLKTRVAQMLGDYKAALSSYQVVRLSQTLHFPFPLPPEFRAMHARAAEDAAFWIGLCQFERGDTQAAAETFGDYLARYGEEGVWTGHSRGLLALSLAEAGRLASAIQVLNTVPADDPQRDSYELLSRRFRQLRDAARSAGPGGPRPH